MELTAANVNEIAGEALFNDDEVEGPEDAKEKGIVVESIQRTFVFHPERLEERREDVVSMLQQLDDKFREEEGGGWSFLNLTHQEDGTLWGQQRDAAVLAALAIGLDLGSWQPTHREVWGSLPGGVPYFYHTA